MRELSPPAPTGKPQPRSSRRLELSTLCQEQTATYAAELRRLSDIAFVFLDAAGGDSDDAEHLLDDFIDLLFEGGALSTWRYRILLAKIHEGL